ncbi:SMP-30/gluconolactonase/LRE family protein [Corynebacterium sp. AOP40-9SA-29]|uniref:SMP-30/gluconolactonase/LRE family protein n=1 Tax=Corynebacterium sp. AOP40-9SA-29 TaxID=3457677 RepID=UPI004034B4FE
MIAEQFTEPVAFHAEGPVWWPQDGSSVAGTLRYVDMTAGRVLTAGQDGSVTAAAIGDPVAAFLRPRRGGGAVVATSRGIAVAQDAVLSDLAPAVDVLTSSSARLNDGGCAPDGTLYAGSMRYDQASGGGVLVAVGADHTVTTVLDAVTVSNGIDWSPDGSLAYYNDTPTRSTQVFSWDANQGLHDGRTLFTLDDNDPAGGPDGLCVDAEGNVWTAIYGGSRVECRDPSGRLIGQIDLPVTNITACTFGGADLDRLFITTTRENVPEGTQPTAGAVYVATPGVQGQPVRPFAG